MKKTVKAELLYSLNVLKHINSHYLSIDIMNLTEYSGALYSKKGNIFRGDVRYKSQNVVPRPLILIIHGFTAFGRWGFFPYVGKRLAEAGAVSAVLEFSFSDYSGTGERVVRPELFAASTVGRELAEISHAISALREADIPEWNGKIYLLGHSRGGGEAILTAAADCTISKVAVWACISTFDRFTARQKRLWRETGFFRTAGGVQGEMPIGMNITYLDDAEHPNRNVLAAASGMNAELLLIHGEQDVTVPLSEAKKITTAKLDAQMEIISGTGHTFGISHPFGGTTPALEAAISATLKFFTLQD